MIGRSPNPLLAAALVVLSTALLPRAARAELGDWAEARREALKASSHEAGSMWEQLAYDQVTVAGYYATLARVAGYTQIDIARQRLARYDDSTAFAAGVHGFIVTGQYDSAAAWAARDPALVVFRRFALARSRGQPFSLADPGTSGVGYDAKSRLQLAMWVRAGGDTLAALVRRCQAAKSATTPEVELIMAIGSLDTNSVATWLEKLEAELAAPPGDSAPALARFGDPLTYWVASQAHALLAVEASGRALTTSTGSTVSQLHLLRGQGYYALGRFEQSAEDLQAADDPLDAPTAAALLVGIALSSGDGKEAVKWKEKCLSAAEREEDDGSGLVMAARVRIEMGAADWSVAQTAARLTQRHKGIPKKTQPAFWAMGMLAAITSLDSASQIYRDASNGRPPFPKEGFSSSFCIDYAGVLAIKGLQGHIGDLVAAYTSLDELTKSVPATRPVVLGLQWMDLCLYSDPEKQRQRLY